MIIILVIIIIIIIIMIITANLRTEILDFSRGFDSNIILNLRAELPRPVGNFPESLSQGILVGIILVGRLGVCSAVSTKTSPRQRLTGALIVLRNWHVIQPF